MEIKRCSWAGSDPLYIEYHDHEWGKPLHDDRMFFEMLILEGMQAGLSWITVLRKRGSFRQAFDNFDPEKIANYGEDKITELMGNTSIIRNERKIRAAVQNARAFLAVEREFGSFDRFIWGFVDYAPVVNSPKTENDVPANTPLSDKISKELKKRGFKFVGTTIVYSFLQAAGIVNDHVQGCFCCSLKNR